MWHLCFYHANNSSNSGHKRNWNCKTEVQWKAVLWFRNVELCWRAGNVAFTFFLMSLVSRVWSRSRGSSYCLGKYLRCTKDGEYFLSRGKKQNSMRFKKWNVIYRPKSRKTSAIMLNKSLYPLPFHRVHSWRHTSDVECVTSTGSSLNVGLFTWGTL